MTQAHIIDGKKLAEQLNENLKSSIQQFSHHRAPGLATILVGTDPASNIYVANKIKTAAKVGIKSIHHDLNKEIKEEELITLVKKLNADQSVDAILIQLPLPKHMNENKVIESIDATKDADGFHPLNLGYLFQGDPKTIACTPRGVMHIFKSIDFDLKGKHAVVIGRSTIVGKPMAHLLLQKDATVTICHSKTSNLAEITRQADVVVAAVGKAKMINKNHLKKGACVIDVGINRDENNKLCGDVDFEDVIETVSYITPVPRGVGPLTIAMLLQNTFDNFVRNH